MKFWRRPFFGAALLFCLLGGLAVPIVILGPVWLVELDARGHRFARSTPLTLDQYTTQFDAYRRTIARILGGIGGLYGLYLVYKRLQVARESHITDKERQITERFTKAIEQLGAGDGNGNKRLEVRFGGIYALERIARDSPRDHWPIMEILTAYVRQNSARKKAEMEKDIQAILTVIGRRTRSNEASSNRLDLRNTDLRDANLERAHLEGANLGGANLNSASLKRGASRGS